MKLKDEELKKENKKTNEYMVPDYRIHELLAKGDIMEIFPYINKLLNEKAEVPIEIRILLVQLLYKAICHKKNIGIVDHDTIVGIEIMNSNAVNPNDIGKYQMETKYGYNHYEPNSVKNKEYYKMILTQQLMNSNLTKEQKLNIINHLHILNNLQQ